MARTTYTIPTPPVFPASNASYNSIVQRMHDAANKAQTPEAALTVIDHLAQMINGKNTYAKAVRRYADQIKVEIIKAHPRYYRTEAAAKTAVTKAGLAGENCIVKAEKGGYLPVLMAKGDARHKAISAGFLVVEA